MKYITLYIICGVQYTIAVLLHCVFTNTMSPKTSSFQELRLPALDLQYQASLSNMPQYELSILLTHTTCLIFTFHSLIPQLGLHDTSRDKADVCRTNVAQRLSGGTV